MNQHFNTIKAIANIDFHEMYKTFNCGIGMIIIVNIENFKLLSNIYNKHNIKFLQSGKE